MTPRRVPTLFWSIDRWKFLCRALASQTESDFPLRSQRERERARRDRRSDVAHIQFILRQKERKKKSSRTREWRERLLAPRRSAGLKTLEWLRSAFTGSSPATRVQLKAKLQRLTLMANAL